MSWHGASTQSTLCPRIAIDSGFAIPSRTDNRLHNPSNDFKTKYYVEKDIVTQQKANSMFIELFGGIYKFLAKKMDEVGLSRYPRGWHDGIVQFSRVGGALQAEGRAFHRPLLTNYDTLYRISITRNPISPSRRCLELSL